MSPPGSTSSGEERQRREWVASVRKAEDSVAWKPDSTWSDQKRLLDWPEWTALSLGGNHNPRAMKLLLEIVRTRPGIATICSTESEFDIRAILSTILKRAERKDVPGSDVFKIAFFGAYYGNRFDRPGVPWVIKCACESLGVRTVSSLDELNSLTPLRVAQATVHLWIYQVLSHREHYPGRIQESSLPGVLQSRALSAVAMTKQFENEFLKFLEFSSKILPNEAADTHHMMAQKQCLPAVGPSGEDMMLSFPAFAGGSWLIVLNMSQLANVGHCDNRG